MSDTDEILLELLPPIPDGYSDPEQFSYPMIAIMIGSGLLGIVASLIFIGLLVRIQGTEVFTFYEVTVEENITTFTMDLAAIGIPFLVALVTTVVIHELIHGLVFRLYGYEVKYGVIPSMGAFYAAVFGEFQSRDELLRVGIAPFVVITAICLPLLAIPVNIVAVTAAFVLILNTAGSIGDFYLVWRLQKMPHKTLFYDLDIRHMYVYQPLRRDETN